MPQRVVPQLLTALDGYTGRDFVTDLLAGVVVGIVALPLAIAFGIASGVTPAQGLYTAIIGGFVIAALSGSRVQIGGPTGAFVVIVYGVIQQYGYDGLAVATLMAGVLLLAMGAARLGGAIKFIPYPVTLGFTAGIALIIAAQQVKDVLGLRMGAVPASFVEKIGAYASHAGSVNWQAFALAAATVALIAWWPRAWSRLPSPFVALVVATVAAQLLHLDVETVGSRFGDVSFAFPHPHWPSVGFADVRRLANPAITNPPMIAVYNPCAGVT
ncbi:MAG TPA: SulP family inorganic anion transporter, partial [Gemmatimonadaceae bacterium]|nr:SulP family inorganic anion transporter [Gemmatimonadaceae bacterium]